ncbi:MAG: hypothetical protein JWM80_4266 [Cyanobacteria bacterium RYN_339]|nr:hypothetical protein [Cyanobacteria bacterium RYN_339]
MHGSRGVAVRQSASALLSMLMAAGCSVSVGTPSRSPGTPSHSPGASAPKTSPSPASSQLPALTDLTGAWVASETAAEPPAGPVPQSCGNLPGVVYALTLTGTQLELTRTWSDDAGGGACQVGKYFPSYRETAKGPYLEGKASLAGQVVASLSSGCSGGATPPPTPAPSDIRFELHLDPASQHLVGTHNGKAIWAAPLGIEAPACPVPPNLPAQRP